MKNTTITPRLIVTLALTAILTAPAAGRSGDQVQELNDRIEVLKGKIEVLEAEVADLRAQQAARYPKPEVAESPAAEQPAEGDAPAEPATEEEDAPEPVEVTYRGEIITQRRFDKLWKTYADTFIIYEGVALDIGEVLEFRDARKANIRLKNATPKWYLRVVRDEGVRLALYIPHVITVDHLVEGGAVCTRMASPGDQEVTYIFLAGEYEEAQELTSVLISTGRHPVVDPTGQNVEVPAFVLPEMITQERFIEELRGGLILYRYSAKKVTDHRTSVSTLQVSSSEVK